MKPIALLAGAAMALAIDSFAPSRPPAHPSAPSAIGRVATSRGEAPHRHHALVPPRPSARA